jgi:hypothetical protein
LLYWKALTSLVNGAGGKRVTLQHSLDVTGKATDSEGPVQSSTAHKPPLDTDQFVKGSSISVTVESSETVLKKLEITPNLGWGSTYH